MWARASRSCRNVGRQRLARTSLDSRTQRFFAPSRGLGYHVPVTKYIGAIDQGTTSTRFSVFDAAGKIVASAQKEHEQIYPQPGWVEHDPDEIWQATQDVMAQALRQGNIRAADLAAIGITNQRETTVLWNRKTGKPVANALVWQDTRVDDYVTELSRDGGPDRFRRQDRASRSALISAA